jgi:hypothetical protein
MPAGKVEYEDISILNNSESGGTSNEDFVMKSEQQPLVYLKLNNFLHSLNLEIIRNRWNAVCGETRMHGVNWGKS